MTKQDIIGGDNLGAATRKMTTKDKLTLIVQAAIRGGWEPIKSNPRILQIDKKLGVLIEYDYENYARKDARIQQAYIAFSLPDIITDPGFMVSLFKGNYCNHWQKEFRAIFYSKECRCGINDCNECEYKISNALRHALEAAKLLLTSTPDAAIEYLYREMKR